MYVVEVFCVRLWKLYSQNFKNVKFIIINSTWSTNIPCGFLYEIRQTTAKKCCCGKMWCIIIRVGLKLWEHKQKQQTLGSHHQGCVSRINISYSHRDLITRSCQGGISAYLSYKKSRICCFVKHYLRIWLKLLNLVVYILLHRCWLYLQMKQSCEFAYKQFIDNIIMNFTWIDVLQGLHIFHYE